MYDTFKVVKWKNVQTRIIYTARVGFKKEEIMNFSKKETLKEFINTKPTLKEMLKGLL